MLQSNRFTELKNAKNFVGAQLGARGLRFHVGPESTHQFPEIYCFDSLKKMEELSKNASR
jgi:hypothetical protein